VSFKPCTIWRFYYLVSVLNKNPLVSGDTLTNDIASAMVTSEKVSPVRSDLTPAYERAIKVGQARVQLLLPIILIFLLPLLDVLLFRVRLPDLSASPVQFGSVASYQNEHGRLEYLVYTPPSYQAGTELPLLVFLHGCLIDPYILESASGMRAVADKNNFMIVYPQQNSASSPHRCWNFYEQKNQRRDEGEPSLLVGIVDQVKQSYSVDARRVYVAGISSGGAMTSILASCYPDIFAAGANHSGLAYKSATSVFGALVATMRGSQTEPNVAGNDAYQCSGTSRRPIPMALANMAPDDLQAQAWLAELQQHKIRGTLRQSWSFPSFDCFPVAESNRLERVVFALLHEHGSILQRQFMAAVFS